MPSWIIHLATAKKVIERININELNINSFLIGNLIADAKRHVVKDFSICVPYHISHFSEFMKIDGNIDELPNIDKFLDSYKNKLSNSMVLGYLIHLLTDYYWNKTTFFRYTIRDNQGNCIGVNLNNGVKLTCDINERNYIKQGDFMNFENYIINQKNYIIPKYENNIIDELKLVKEVSFNESDIKKIIKYVENKSKEENEEETEKYKLFTKEQILKDFQESIDFIVGYLQKLDIRVKE